MIDKKAPPDQVPKVDAETKAMLEKLIVMVRENVIDFLEEMGGEITEHEDTPEEMCQQKAVDVSRLLEEFSQIVAVIDKERTKEEMNKGADVLDHLINEIKSTKKLITEPITFKVMIFKKKMKKKPITPRKKKKTETEPKQIISQQHLESKSQDPETLAQSKSQLSEQKISTEPEGEDNAQVDKNKQKLQSLKASRTKKTAKQSSAQKHFKQVQDELEKLQNALDEEDESEEMSLLEATTRIKSFVDERHK
jgi:hypothetical protein